jgi:hypothetical protein
MLAISSTNDFFLFADWGCARVLNVWCMCTCSSAVRGRASEATSVQVYDELSYILTTLVMT